MNQNDFKKLPLDIATKAKKIIIETSKDLYNNVVEVFATDVQANLANKRYEDLPVKSAIGITGEVCSIKTFEELEENLGKGNAVDFLPITESINAWKKMNEKTELGPLIKAKVDQFNGSKEVYMQVGGLTHSERMEKAKKHVDYEGASRVPRPGTLDFDPSPIPPSKEIKEVDDHIFSNIKETIKKRLNKVFNKAL